MEGCVGGWGMVAVGIDFVLTDFREGIFAPIFSLYCVAARFGTNLPVNLWLGAGHIAPSV